MEEHDNYPAPRRRVRPGRILIYSFAIAREFFSIAVGVVIIAYLFNLGLGQYFHNRAGNTLEDRIQVLTRSLNEAAVSISDVEAEISKRSQLVEKLQHDADEARQLSTLNSQQVSAISQALQGQLRTESQSSFWMNVVINIGFAFLGAVFGEGFRLVRERRSTVAQANDRDTASE